MRTCVPPGVGVSVHVLGEQGKQPPAPKVTVVDASGKTVYEETLEYG